jgi:hypothetical protein
MPSVQFIYSACQKSTTVCLDLTTVVTSCCSIYCSLWSIGVHKTSYYRFQPAHLQHILQISSLSRLTLMRMFCIHDLPSNGFALMSPGLPIGLAIGLAHHTRLHIFPICIPTHLLVIEIVIQRRSHLSKCC